MRLVDADELIKKFKYSDAHTEDENVWCATFRQMIKEQPTAYDIDNVVEELEAEIKLYENSKSIMGGNDFDIECDGAMKGLGKAIEIVKQGVR